VRESTHGASALEAGFAVANGNLDGSDRIVKKAWAAVWRYVSIPPIEKQSINCLSQLFSARAFLRAFQRWATCQRQKAFMPK